MKCYDKVWTIVEGHIIPAVISRMIENCVFDVHKTVEISAVLHREGIPVLDINGEYMESSLSELYSEPEHLLTFLKHEIGKIKISEAESAGEEETF